MEDQARCSDHADRDYTRSRYLTLIAGEYLNRVLNDKHVSRTLSFVLDDLSTIP